MPSYQDIKDFYNDIKNDKIMIWTFRILLIAFVSAFIYSAFISFKDGSNGKPTRFGWGLYERNNEPITVLIHDTIYKETVTLATNPSSKKGEIQRTKEKLPSTLVPNITQNNDSGKNEINQNFGTNEGIIGGSGHTIIKEKQFTEADKTKLLNKIKALQKENVLTYDVELSTNMSTNDRLTYVIKDFLESKGYKVVMAGSKFLTGKFPDDGYWVEFKENKIIIIAADLP